MVTDDVQAWIDQASIPVGSSVIVQEVSTPVQGVVQEDGSITQPETPASFSLQPED
jgi:hypothetical protein